MYRNNKTGGFTLLELSVVIVIIGLIVGAVLFGQDLITAAKIRALQTQLERYNAATNTFLDKYGFLPGDIPYDATKPWAPFFSQPGVFSSCESILGNGNGLIHNNHTFQSSPIAQNFTSGYQFVGEIPLYFNHLSVENLIEGSFNKNCTDGLVVGVTIPNAAHGRGGFVVYAGFMPPVNFGTALSYTTSVVKHFFRVGIDNNTSGSPATLNMKNTLTTREAYTFDSKIDDGLPTKGAVRGTGSEGAGVNPEDESLTGTCVDSTSGTTLYNISGNTLSCSLKVLAGF